VDTAVYLQRNGSHHFPPTSQMTEAYNEFLSANEKWEFDPPRDSANEPARTALRDFHDRASEECCVEGLATHQPGSSANKARSASILGG
jgi:hypothetical protein